MRKLWIVLGIAIIGLQLCVVGLIFGERDPIQSSPWFFAPGRSGAAPPRWKYRLDGCTADVKMTEWKVNPDGSACYRGEMMVDGKRCWIALSWDRPGDISRGEWGWLGGPAVGKTYSAAPE